MFFSQNFIEDLETKSVGFQNAFYAIAESFYEFFEYDKEKIKEFDTYIESQISYHGEGNLLNGGNGFFIGGEIDASRQMEYAAKIVDYFRELFLFPEDTGMDIATNIIMTINLPESISAIIITLIEMTIKTLKPDSPPTVKVYVKHDYSDCFQCYIAIMK